MVIQNSFLITNNSNFLPEVVASKFKYLFVFFKNALCNILRSNGKHRDYCTCNLKHLCARFIPHATVFIMYISLHLFHVAGKGTIELKYLTLPLKYSQGVISYHVSKHICIRLVVFR